MTRRRREKQQHENYLAVVQGKWAEFNGQARLNSACSFWMVLPKLHRQILTYLIPVILIIAVIPLPEPQSSDSESETPAVPQRVEVGLDITPLDQQSDTAKSSQSRTEQSTKALVRSAWISYTVKDGDTLSQLFRENDLPLSDLNDLIRIEGSDKPLSHIRPGQLVRYKLNKEGRLDILQLEKDGQSIMFFRLSDGGFGRSS